MDDLTVYVVRIYRRDATGMAGVVESFHTTEQLWHALHDLPSPRRTLVDHEQLKGDMT